MPNIIGVDEGSSKDKEEEEEAEEAGPKEANPYYDALNIWVGHSVVTCSFSNADNVFSFIHLLY